ncbi:hypothetical protein KIW84_030838 [Lathyrus oleraceus]|uniref:Uncharacterized protein n=1 Tax=Pisum sativum TaxID=3888 RepID=A0A9D4XPL1_PEA|nr:hypothetical protein KIW84_030838 [Pisum sativum]
METPELNTQPITTTSSLSLPKLCKKTNSHKVENLIKYSHVPEDAQIYETIPPLLSPYNIFKRQRSVTRSIRNLISTNHPHMKEYVQSSRLDQCSLRATNQEQLILSLYGRKNQPIFCKITLLDSSYLHYENAVIGTVLTTLHAGSVVLTIFPNYNRRRHIVQIPRRITREELSQLIPLEWITNYERLHVDRRPIQSQEATFRRSIDKTVKTIFKNPDEGSTSMSPIFQIMMIQSVLKEDWCPVHAVTTEGKPIYTDKIDGHFIWDVDPTRWRCKPSPPPQRRFDPDNGQWVGTHGKNKTLSIYEEGLKILRKEGLLPPYDPTLVTWSPTDHFQPDGKLKPLTQAEELLNWKSENMVSQNEILQSLDKRVDKIAEKIDDTNDNLKVLSQKIQKHYRSLKAQVSQLDCDLRQMLEE